MSNTNEDNELFDRDTPPQEEEKVDSNAAAREEHNRRIARIIEKDTHYIFFFGKIASGKSAIITYFINYLLGESEGTLVLTDLGESAYTNELLERFASNSLVKRTNPMLDPTTIDLRYEPRDTSKPKKFFTILEMAGEDLELLGYKNRKNTSEVGKLPKGIQAYFDAKGISITFILCTPFNKANEDAALLSAFIQHVEKNRNKFKKYTYALLATKWDKNIAQKRIQDFANENQLQFVIDQIKHKDPLVMGYSIGEVSETDSLVLDVNKKCPEDLWHWLYEDMTGVPLKDPYIPPTRNLWQRLKDFLLGPNNE